MLLEKFICGPLQTNCYLIGCIKTKIAAVIDPAKGSAPLIVTACEKNEMKLKKILLTHSHWDHIVDVAALYQETSAEVWVHILDAENLQYPGADQLPLFFSIQGLEADHFYEKDLSVGDLQLKVIHTPGHSPGSVCLYLEKEDLLFSGDTLFAGTMGNVSFPNSEPKKMWESLKKLQSLPKKTRVLPGHGPDTILSEESWIGEAEKLYNNQ